MKASTIILIIAIIVALGVSLIVYLPKEVLQPFLDKKYKVEPVQEADSLAQMDKNDTEKTGVKPPEADFGSLLDEGQSTVASKHLPDSAPYPIYEIVVKKSLYKLDLYRDGEPLKTYDVAVGNKAPDKLSKDDMVTPLGNFYIVSIESSKGRKSNSGMAYGIWLIRLRTDQLVTASGKGWLNIGIHGDGKSSEMGSSLNTDCVIMQNNDLKELKDYIYNEYKHYNIPVRIVP